MELELRHLRVLCAIADAGSLGRAASELGYSQPAMSTQFQRIERFFGQSLFERGVSGVKLTRFGVEVVVQARDVLARAEAIGLRPVAGTTSTRRTLRVAATNSPVLSGMVVRVRSPVRRPRAILNSPSADPSERHVTMKTSDHPEYGSAFAPVDHRAAVSAETARFVSVVEGADLTTAVTSCPGWTLADLVKHTGSVQRWFSVLLRARIQEPPRKREVDLHLPDQEDAYADWLAESATVAAEAFAAIDPNLSMWAWGADQHARFWARRMLFETLLHRVDAELALGLRPTIDGPVAVDGIDEFLVNLPFAAFFAPEVANLRGADKTIRFRATAEDGEWLVRLRPDGFGLDARPSTDIADATVQGTAADLLLLVYGRLSYDSEVLVHEGDEGLLAHWFANSAF